MSVSSLAGALLAAVSWDAGLSTPLFLGPRSAVPPPSWVEFRVECEVPVRLRGGIQGKLLVRVSDFHAGRSYRTDYALPVEFPPGSHKLVSLPFFLPAGARASASLRSGSPLAATFPRNLNARPLPEGSAVYGFLGSSREQALLKKYMYDEGLELDADVRLARLRPDRLPARWELLPAEGVIVDAGIFARLGGEDLSTFLDYALSGGALVILGRREDLPRAAAPFFAGEGSTPFGMGRLALVERKEGWQKKALALALPHATPFSEAVPNEKGLIARLDRIAVKSASATQLAFILAAYVILAVPVSALVFWRLGRKEQAWWASLFVAAAFSVFTVLRGGVPLSGGAELKEVGVLCASAGWGRGVYGSVVAVYATGSRRLSVVFREGVLVRQAFAPSPARGFRSARRARVEGRVVSDVFVPAQSVRQFVSTGSFDLKGVLRAERLDGGGWAFENRTRLDLVNCVVRSGEKFLEVGGIPSRCNGRTRGPAGQLTAPPGADWQALASVFSRVGSTGGSYLLGWVRAPDPPRVERGSKSSRAWWLCAFALGERPRKVEVRRLGKGAFLLVLNELPEKAITIKVRVRSGAHRLQVHTTPGRPQSEEVQRGGVIRIMVAPKRLDPDVPAVRLSLTPLHHWYAAEEEETEIELGEVEVEM